MSQVIRWWRIDLGEDEANALAAALKARRITTGPLTEELERRLAEFLGVPYCVLVNSGASALAAALIAVGVGPGTEVVVPGMTFVATANAARLIGARVKLVDVLPDRPLLDPAALRYVVGPRTMAIVPVHLGGRAVNLRAVAECSRGIAIIEDAAQAFFSKNSEGFLGTQSAIGCLSFGITKLLPMGEGGACLTRDQGLAESLKRIRNNGALSLRANDFQGLGFNFRPLDLLAALGLVALEKVEERAHRLRWVYKRYEAGLKSLKTIRLLPVYLEAGELPLWIEVVAAEPEKVILELQKRGIEARRFGPALCDVLPEAGEDLPCSRFFADHGLVLPSGPDREEWEVDKVLEVLAEIDRQSQREAPLQPERAQAKRFGRLGDETVFRCDRSGRSVAYFLLKAIPIDDDLLDELEKAAAQEGGVARICLHQELTEHVQDMIIAKTKAARIRPGKYTKRARVFHVLRGRLALLFFGKNGTIEGARVLGPGCPVYRVAAGNTYADLPLEKSVIYREVILGPKTEDTFEVAPWWPKDEQAREKMVFRWLAHLEGAAAGVQNVGLIEQVREEKQS